MSQPNSNNSHVPNQHKANHDKLKKTADGNNYTKWFERLQEEFASNSAVVVKQYGPDLLRDQKGYLESFRAEYNNSDDIEKAGLLKRRNERQNAVEIIFNLIMSKLSEEVKRLVEAEQEYVEMRDNVAKRGPYELLKIIRRVVNSGITSDPTYQTMVNVRALHELKQNQKESIGSYIERIKVARDAFLSTCPHGVMFAIPDMKASVHTLDSLEGMSAAQRTRIFARTDPWPPAPEKVFNAAELTPVLTNRSWITDEYLVRVAILGLNEKCETLKMGWKTRMLDKNGNGPTLPANLEELTQRILQHEAMDRHFLATEVVGVKATVVKKRKSFASKSQGGNDGKPGNKFRKQRGQSGKSGECSYCHKQGHQETDCRKKKADGLEEKKGAEKADKKVTEVKVTNVLEDYYLDPTDQFMLS